MPELISTLKAIYEKEHRNNKFMASLKGIDIDSSQDSSNESSEKITTHEEVYARVAKRLGASESQAGAIEHGIPTDMGIGYEVVYG